MNVDLCCVSYTKLGGKSGRPFTGPFKALSTANLLRVCWLNLCYLKRYLKGTTQCVAASILLKIWRMWTSSHSYLSKESATSMCWLAQACYMPSTSCKYKATYIQISLIQSLLGYDYVLVWWKIWLMISWTVHFLFLYSQHCHSTNPFIDKYDLKRRPLKATESISTRKTSFKSERYPIKRSKHRVHICEGRYKHTYRAVICCLSQINFAKHIK